MFFTSGQSNSTSGHVHRPRESANSGRQKPLFLCPGNAKLFTSGEFFHVVFWPPFRLAVRGLLPSSLALSLSRRGQRNLFFELSKWRCSKETRRCSAVPQFVSSENRRGLSGDDDDDGTAPFAIADSSTSRSKRGKETVVLQQRRCTRIVVRVMFRCYLFAERAWKM